jgi:hypothetical protein
VTGDMALTAAAPPELQPALPDLPALASELTATVDALRKLREADEGAP